MRLTMNCQQKTTPLLYSVNADMCHKKCHRNAQWLSGVSLFTFIRVLKQLMYLFISSCNKCATKQLDNIQTMIYDDNKITFLKKITSNKLRTFK